MLLTKLISRLKGEDFILSDKLPFSYIVNLLFSKGVSMLYGNIRMRTIKRVFVHPTSTIICASSIKFGKNLSIGRKCYINALSEKGLIIGDNVSMGHYTHVELTGSLKKLGKGFIIGNNVGLGTHGFYGSGVGGAEIGDDTIIGNYVSIHPENHIFSDLSIPIRKQGVNGVGVKIGRNCWIGAKVTVLDGTVIGDNCVVAAGAVVRGHFPDNCVIGGIPAKILKMR